MIYLVLYLFNHLKSILVKSEFATVLISPLLATKRRKVTFYLTLIRLVSFLELLKFPYKVLAESFHCSFTRLAKVTGSQARQRVGQNLPRGTCSAYSTGARVNYWFIHGHFLSMSSDALRCSAWRTSQMLGVENLVKMLRRRPIPFWCSCTMRRHTMVARHPTTPLLWGPSRKQVSAGRGTCQFPTYGRGQWNISPLPFQVL